MSELESHVFTEIEIDATADQVWAVLTDFEKLPDGRAKFKQEDGLNGKKSNFLVRMVEAQIGKAYDKFNRELKARLESLYPRS
jgi:uncharacterized membrane protein